MREGRWDYIKYSLKKELGWGKRRAYIREEETNRKGGLDFYRKKVHAGK